MLYSHKNGISLRKLEREDLPLLKELKDESWFGTNHTTIVNMEDQHKWFDSLTSSSLLLIAVDARTAINPTLGLFGLTNIDNISRTCEYTHSVFKLHRGKGYGKKTLEAGIDFAFEVLNFRRISTLIIESNIPEIKSAMYAGFKKEGTKRQDIYKCGKYLDNIVYGLLRKEWEISDRVKSYGSSCHTL